MKKKTYINIICLLVILFWFILFIKSNSVEFIVTVSAFTASLLMIDLLPNKKNCLFTLLPLVLPTALLFYSTQGFVSIMPIIMLLCNFKYLKRIDTTPKEEITKSDKLSGEQYALIITDFILSSIMLYILISDIISQKNIFTNIPHQMKWIYYIFISFVLLILVVLSSKKCVTKYTSSLRDKFNFRYSIYYHIMYIAALILFVLSIAAFTSSTTDILKTVYPWLMYIFILIFYKDPFVDFIIEKCTQKIHSALESL